MRFCFCLRFVEIEKLISLSNPIQSGRPVSNCAFIRFVGTDALMSTNANRGPNELYLPREGAHIYDAHSAKSIWANGFSAARLSERIFDFACSSDRRERPSFDSEAIEELLTIVDPTNGFVHSNRFTTCAFYSKSNLHQVVVRLSETSTICSVWNRSSLPVFNNVSLGRIEQHFSFCRQVNAFLSMHRLRSFVVESSFLAGNWISLSRRVTSLVFFSSFVGTSIVGNNGSENNELHSSSLWLSIRISFDLRSSLSARTVISIPYGCSLESTQYHPRRISDA